MYSTHISTHTRLRMKEKKRIIYLHFHFTTHVTDRKNIECLPIIIFLCICVPYLDVAYGNWVFLGKRYFLCRKKRINILHNSGKKCHAWSMLSLCRKNWQMFKWNWHIILFVFFLVEPHTENIILDRSVFVFFFFIKTCSMDIQCTYILHSIYTHILIHGSKNGLK